MIFNQKIEVMEKKMRLIDIILGRKVIEVTRNVDGSFKVSTPYGYGWKNVEDVGEMKESLNQLAEKSKYKGKYRTKLSL